MDDSELEKKNKRYKIRNLTVRAIALVDYPANRRKFLLVKRDNLMDGSLGGPMSDIQGGRIMEGDAKEKQANQLASVLEHLEAGAKELYVLGKLGDEDLAKVREAINKIEALLPKTYPYPYPGAYPYPQKYPYPQGKEIEEAMEKRMAEMETNLTGLRTQINSLLTKDEFNKMITELADELKGEKNG